MSKHPLVSVIIPTFNRETYLRQALQSVADQTYKNIEIIVVDDGSPTNQNKEICQSYKNTTYIKIKNSGGPAKPRNTGIKLAKGEYVAFLDDDDLWLPHKLETQVTILEKHKEFGLVHTPCNTIDSKGNSLNKTIGNPKTPNLKHGNVVMRMIGNWTLMMPTPLIRKSVVEQVGFFNENMPNAGEDVEFWTRTGFYTNFYYIDQPLALYRVHPQNISAQSKKYVHLPKYLKKVLDRQKQEKNINKKQYNQLLKNVIKSQIKHIKKQPMKTLSNLFKLQVFWFLNPFYLKLLVYVLLKTSNKTT